MSHSNAKKWIAFAISLTGAIILVVLFFLPFARAIGENRQELAKAPNDIYIEEIGMTNKEAMEVSLFEYVQIHFAALRLEFGRAMNVFAVILLCLMALSAVGTLVFTALRKLTPIILLNTAAFLAFAIFSGILRNREALPSDDYAYGIAYYLYYVATCLGLGGIAVLVFGNQKNTKGKKETPSKK